MRKYGVSNFSVEIIEETDSPEEREVFWIEQKGSFKNGYNATMGGDGKKYIDYDLVITTYNNFGTVKETAKSLDICEDTVSSILHSRGVNVKSTQDIIRERESKMVSMYSLNNEYIRTFPSTQEAARYMVENKLTGCKHSTIRTHISEVCRGKRKTAAKFKWKFE